MVQVPVKGKARISIICIRNGEYEMKYTLQQNAYQGFTPVEIDVPDSWQVQWNGIVGDDAPALTMEQIKQKLNRPYGSPTLKELARDAKKVCIVFDDISRGTPTRIMAEAVLDELLQAGVQKDQIRFLCALGTHGAHNRMDFVQKLGEKMSASIRSLWTVTFASVWAH